MAEANQPTRVVALVDPGVTQQQITAALSSGQEFQLVDLISELDKLARQLHAADPELRLLDHTIGGQPTLDVIDDLALQFPQVPVVAILPGEDPLLAQQVTLAGARAFIVQPFTQAGLLSTLRRVRDLEARRRHAQLSLAATSGEKGQAPLRTLAVYGPRGGSGCSTLAANLAICLHERTRESVLLVDGKLSFGHLDVLLNLRTRNTLSDLLPYAAQLDQGLVQDVVSGHPSGIDVLLAPSELQAAQGVRAEDVYNVLAGLKRFYDYLVIDAGSALTENTVTLLDAADRILLVTAPDLAALHDASRFIQVCRTLAYPPAKLLVVLNKAGMVGGVKPKDIEGVLHQPLFAQVPDDAANAIRSLNRGIPLALQYPRSRATRALQELAGQLVRLNAGVNQAPVGGEAAARLNGRAKAKAGKQVRTA